MIIQIVFEFQTQLCLNFKLSCVTAEFNLIFWSSHGIQMLLEGLLVWATPCHRTCKKKQENSCKCTKKSVGLIFRW